MPSSKHTPHREAAHAENSPREWTCAWKLNACAACSSSAARVEGWHRLCTCLMMSGKGEPKVHSEEHHPLASCDRRTLDPMSKPGGNGAFEKLLQYLDGFRLSQALFAGCSLGVFDALERQGRGYAEVAQLAHELHVSTDGLKVRRAVGGVLKLVPGCHARVGITAEPSPHPWPHHQATSSPLR